MDIELKCKKCGQPLAIDEKDAGKEAKCPKCGTGFTVPTAEEAKAQAAPPSAEEAKAQAAPASAGGERRCPACGAPVKPEARFCNSCGSEISKEAAPSGKKTSGFAIASLILGVLGFCTTITSIPGLILGIVGLQRIKRSGGTLTGQGMAIAGIVTSALVVALVMIAFAAMSAAITFPPVVRAREQARRIVCMSNLRQIGLGCKMWAEDHDGEYPSSLALEDLYPKYLSLNVLVCPSTEDEVTTAEETDEKGSYVYVSGLRADADFPSDTVLIYDRKGNHGEGRNVLLVDGHVEWVREDEFSELLNRSP